jgi:hypothetical protein
MYESHLDDEGLGSDALGDDDAWKAQAVQAGAGVLSTITEAVTGIPAPTPQMLAQPSTAAVPTVNPNAYLPQVITKNPSKVLLIGGIVAVGVVGYLFLSKSGNAPTRRRRRQRRR